MAEIFDAMSSVAAAVWAASDFTSCATTAKPRPASPARAASMVALSASRLVCPATSRMRPRIDSMAFAWAESDSVTATAWPARSEEHTSELQSLMRISYAVFCLKKKKKTKEIQIIKQYILQITSI